MSKCNGFTLLELMITLTIAAILSTLAVPSFSNIIKNNRMATQYNELLTSLTIARSEAIKRGSPLVICKSNDLATPACGGNWQDGWLVFVDSDEDGVYDPGDSDELVRIHSVLSGNNTLHYNRDNVKYSANGLALGSNGTFTFCDDRGDLSSRGLKLHLTGRARKAIDGDALASCSTTS